MAERPYESISDISCVPPDSTSSAIISAHPLKRGQLIGDNVREMAGLPIGSYVQSRLQIAIFHACQS